MAEVRTQLEGSLMWVQASASGTTWATASAPQSGAFGFVDSMTVTSGATIETQSDRGTPNHHKQVSRQPVQINVTCRWTGFNVSAASGSGASVPMIHLEYRASAAETPATGRYMQFYGVPIHNLQFTEQANGDTMQYTFVALGMNGPTASGFLS